MKKIIAGLFITLFAINIAQAAEEEFAKKTIQIGMIVSDLDKSMNFYKDVVGLFRSIVPLSTSMESLGGSQA